MISHLGVLLALWGATRGNKHLQETMEFLCPDGKLTNNKDTCQGFMGCDSTLTPYMCSDGACAENQKKCNIRFSKEQAKFG